MYKVEVLFRNDGKIKSFLGEERLKESCSKGFLLKVFRLKGNNAWQILELWQWNNWNGKYYKLFITEFFNNLFDV